ncbi:M10 family metallopeptidase C-terminal domain-containing protein [Parapusillimonas sp. JC17]|uniref:M10 family metallopeptidase C-terminal domain-containing protein n=1 Tax=Parapusillimonas sp. JC17 TaxID=3445768 RepID=UPI003FA172DC
MTAAVWTDQQVLNQLINETVWTLPVLRFGFPATARETVTLQGEATSFVPLDDAQQAMAVLGMAAWADLIAIPVQQTPATAANLRFGLTTTDIEFAHAYYPPVGSIWFNGKEASLLNPAVGNYGFSTYVHEIGHALGLNHMGDYGGKGNWQPSSYQDSVVYSIMSYFGPEVGEGEGQVAWGNWKDTSGKVISPQTPMLNDILAIQAIYGVSNARADHTVYGFGSTAEGVTAQLYDFSINKTPILALYDAGGIDTLDLSGWSTDSHINLAPGSFSSANGMTNNLSIARNTIIENLTTGAGNDKLIGNHAHNVLRGGAGDDIFVGSAGNDMLHGEDGDDSVQYMGSAADFRLAYHLPDDSHTIADSTGAFGTDRLFSIENAIFNDVSAPVASLTPTVMRFYNPANGSHFHTANAQEARALYLDTPEFIYEGVLFNRVLKKDSTTVDVHRFFNTATQSHFYTADEHEAAFVQTSFPSFVYEGIAYWASAVKTQDSVEVHRFYNAQKGSHFYTADAAEAEHVQLALAGSYAYEGVAYYAGTA